MPDLLLEVLSEEIPARMQAGGAQELERRVLSRLEESRLAHEGAETFATPRRLALLVKGLLAVQPDITVERKGPRVGAPDKAIEGFLKSTGLTLGNCEQRETPKGPVWFAVMSQKGRPTTALLADLLPEALAAVSWPKSMRWEESGTRWVRPIRSILCLLDDAVVPFRFGTVESGRTTLGHRFLSPGPPSWMIQAATRECSKAAYVMLRLGPAEGENQERRPDADETREALSHGRRGSWTRTRVSSEWPVVLMGTIDERFMDLPVEVLRSAMRHAPALFERARQRCRSVGAPLRHGRQFRDRGRLHRVIAGNERVLRARLADARFFWDQDRRYKLEDNVPVLQGVVFHARLGSMAYKVQRIEVLARILCRWIEDADPDLAARAGLLCKADLVTEMVGEFPDLQGVMGRYYARADGESPEVCAAIAEHYAPRGAGRTLSDEASERRGGARGQARHARRLLRHRRAADRLQGPFRAAPRRSRRDPARHREQFAPASFLKPALAKARSPATVRCCRRKRKTRPRPTRCSLLR